jgi:hypothetical protein
MKLDDIKLSPEEIKKAWLDKSTNNLKNPEYYNVLPEDTAIADSATLKALKKVSDELWNIWDSPDRLHAKIREIDSLIKELETND